MNDAPATLLISQDVIAGDMAGPGIRYYQLACTLAVHVPVTLAIPDHSPVWDRQHSFNIVRYTQQQWDGLAPHVHIAQVVIFPSDLAAEFPQIAQMNACFVMDGYDPQLAEWLSLTSHLDASVAMSHWQRACSKVPAASTRLPIARILHSGSCLMWCQWVCHLTPRRKRNRSSKAYGGASMLMTSCCFGEAGCGHGSTRCWPFAPWMKHEG